MDIESDILNWNNTQLTSWLSTQGFKPQILQAVVQQEITGKQIATKNAGRDLLDLDEPDFNLLGVSTLHERKLFKRAINTLKNTSG
jgi:hypothetical protein